MLACSSSNIVPSISPYASNVPMLSSHSTLSRRSSESTMSAEPQILDPLPLRTHPLFSSPPGSSTQMDADDLFSPCKSHMQPYSPPSSLSRPMLIPSDDDDASIFLAPSFTSIAHSPAHSTHTPVKKVRKTVPQSAKNVKAYNNNTPTGSVAITTSSRTGGGTKRKSLAQNSNTPLRSHVLTPLETVSPKRDEQSSAHPVIFGRLAPLSAPKFVTHTPHAKMETEVHLRKQTTSLTKLKLTDFSQPGNEFGSAMDSGCELDDGDEDLFREDVRQAANRQLFTLKGEAEVVEAISPDGHVNKRRARSRPVSSELLNHLSKSSVVVPSPKKSLPNKVPFNRPSATSVSFPSTKSARSRTTSASSQSSDGLSPAPRRRVIGTVNNSMPSRFPQVPKPPIRRPLDRAESTSSATLFFGPLISQPLAPAAAILTHPLLPARTHSSSHHNPSSSTDTVWNTIQEQDSSSSPFSSPMAMARCVQRKQSFDEEEEFFGSGPRNSSFVFNLTHGTVSPQIESPEKSVLPTKYKPRDSAVLLSEDEDIIMGNDNGKPALNCLTVMPRASASVNSISSDADDGLVTPGVGSEYNTNWPGPILVCNPDDRHDFESELGPDGYVDVDAFIARTLAAPTKAANSSKKTPGTPVKSRTIGLASRPWQSAVAHKVGFPEWDAKGNALRKSLPAAFPRPGQKTVQIPNVESTSDSEGEEESPSGTKAEYSNLGLGRPPVPAVQRTRWLMRRSSSGAFSSGSDAASLNETPTRPKAKDWHLPIPRFSIASPPKIHKSSPARAASSSSTFTLTSVSPTKKPHSRHLPIAEKYMRHSYMSASPSKLSAFTNSEQHPDRFERDFVEIGEVGSGEFGKVIKVRCKLGDDEQFYAIKRSKTFEGPKHRLRLREEVDILKHLQQTAVLRSDSGGHPNVLNYVDSWEEEEALFIRTELCESGNLAGFLWEYGRVFPRLDEARVWKIIVDLSNGLQFIHEAGVIHLDLKPSNIFVTAEGRFKIGDFGMASLWPRSNKQDKGTGSSGFEREGDKVYLAPEVLQGEYGKAADVFSFGVTILETATNIVVPDQGEAWHRLREEDFSQIDLDDSPELLQLISQMMRNNPNVRISVQGVCEHPIVSRARAIMERTYLEAKANRTCTFAASPLSSVSSGFLEEILGRTKKETSAMDVTF